MKSTGIEMKFAPVTKDKWSNFETLFGRRGACGGCWCMLWRLTRKEFERQKGTGNRQAMKAIIQSGKTPGILGIIKGQPVAWCSVAPREHFPSLGRSRILRPLDDLPVWSITCLFVETSFRRMGVSGRMIRAAVEHVKKQGGQIVEAYPVEPKKDKMPDVFAWTGLASSYLKAEFVECARRSETRPMMRYYIEN